MSGPWLLLFLILILTLTGVPGGCAQSEEEVQEDTIENALSLPDDLMRKELQRVRGDLRKLESVIFPHDWIYKRQHPGKREKAEKGAEVVVDLEPPKPELPVPWDEAPLLPDFVKRQHPGRRSPWMEYPVFKRQRPGRRLDPNFDSWEEEEEGEGPLMPEKRQHPGRRAPGDPCWPQGACDEVGNLWEFLDLSKGREEAQKGRPQQVAWIREPLEE